MTISSNVPRVPFACNGVTTDFPFPYPVLSASDLSVIETVLSTGVETPKVLTTDFTLVGSADAGGAYLSGVTVKANAAPSSLVIWTVINDPGLTQAVDLTDNGALPVDSQVERPLDRLTLITQRLKDLIDRSVRQPDGDAATIGRLPSKVDRASKFLAFDTNGNPVVVEGSADGFLVTPFMATVLGSASVVTALSAISGGNLTTVSGILYLLGGKLIFPSTQIPSASPGTLDDYKEGSWTPTITFGGAGVGITYSTNAGTYIKIGRLVIVTFQIVLTSKGSSTGALAIAGLPFPAVSGLNPYAPMLWSNLATAYSSVLGRIAGGGSTAVVVGITAAATTNNTGLLDTNVANNTYLDGGFAYLSQD